MSLQNTQNLVTDLCRDHSQRILVKQYEKNSRFILIKCTENGKFYPLNNKNTKCNIKMLTPDNRAIYNPCEILDSGLVRVGISESMVYAAGVAHAELNVVDLEEASVLATMTFDLVIKPSPYPDDRIADSDEFSTLLEIIANEKKHIDALLELEMNVQANEEIRKDHEEDRMLLEEQRIHEENIRIENENNRLTNELHRQENEDTRISNEESRVVSEISRQDHDSERALRDTQWIHNEELRSSNEEMRIENERSRQLAEHIRDAQEQTRQINEKVRKQNEIRRAHAENDRIINENIRCDNEELRKQNEFVRQETESERILNENTRVDNERLRKISEMDREEDEADRVTNENIRNASEKRRLYAEKIRELYEDNRRSEERDREDAEELRRLQIEMIIDDTATAKDRANAAALACENIVTGYGFIPVAEKGTANGVATLDKYGIVPSNQLPSYVDKIYEGTAVGITKNEETGSLSATSFILTGAFDECIPTTGVIYLDITNNIQYRWTGKHFITTGTGLSLGELPSTAFYGNLGKIAYDHSQSPHAIVDATKAEQSDTNGNIIIDGVDTNVYTHPDTHPATMIVEDANHRFVTDQEKKKWNSVDTTLSSTSTNPVQNKVIKEAIDNIGTFIASPASPSKTNTLWIDTANGSILKYHNGSSWVPVHAVWS